jgi:hypothetical protein
MAAGCLVLQALVGDPQLTLHLTHLFVLVALLLSGHYVAEDRIVEGWMASRPPAARVRRARWALRRDVALASLLDRSPLCERGPPALAALSSLYAPATTGRG